VRLRRTIVDRHNRIRIESGARIGFDPEYDAQRYPLSPGGVVVVPRGRTPFFARDEHGSVIGYTK
jgi:glucose-1-phosphate adenylyltransferase